VLMTSVVADIRQVVWSTNCTRPIGEALSCGQRALQGSHSVTMAVTRDILYATTTELDITAGLITAGFWKPIVIAHHCRFLLKSAVIGPTDTDIRVFIAGSYHCRFVAWTDSDML
jgi:hypothetical protein